MSQGEDEVSGCECLSGFIVCIDWLVCFFGLACWVKLDCIRVLLSITPMLFSSLCEHCILFAKLDAISNLHIFYSTKQQASSITFLSFTASYAPAFSRANF
jgi:hypothetical protein